MTRTAGLRESFSTGSGMLRRAISRATTSVLGLVLLAPVLALLPTAVLDIGPEPESRARFSMFPLALAALDPLIWTSLWNSVAVAVIVAVGSLVIGVALGGLVARFRFWGRPVFSALITAPAVVAPALLALGMLGLFDPCGPRGIGSLVDSIARVQEYSARIVALAGLGLGRIDPGGRPGRGHDEVGLRPSATLLLRMRQDWPGQRPLRVWWTLTWPTLRPPVALGRLPRFHDHPRGPAAPLVLGLRRTLGFQMVATALGPTRFPGWPPSH